MSVKDRLPNLRVPPGATGSAPVPKDAQSVEFETYLKDREDKRETSSCPIEKAGTKAALDRCRMLADRIASDLREKKPEHFVNILSLAEFQASLERAASVLEQNPDIANGLRRE
jgi:hypothetical protein